ncbi:MAG: ATP-dependent Clp protease ATP-binding subunit ClpX [Lachnospiraceae bacterium]|nr:ATP-dependent Clp protease ATP-binding subunit ClpX [Lachnospiraceae bacterium]
MSGFDEDIFFDEEEKEEGRKLISEDDFDETAPETEKQKSHNYKSIQDTEDDEFRDDFDIVDTEDDDYEEIAVVVGEEEVALEDADGGSDEDAADADEADDEDTDDDEKEYEDVCFVCRRPESVTGKQFKLPNNICVCNDCMHKTMDAVSQFDYQGMLDPNMMDQAIYGMDLNELSSKFPNISFVNLADLQGDGGIPNKQKLKKKKKKDKKKKDKPVLDIKNIPPPHKIKAQLDEYVVGQDQAKKVISVAVYNHYKRVATQTMDEIEIEKSNMLMIGPTGCGKTYLVKTLAKLLDVPLAITDATSLTEAGYIGDDIESVVSKLLAAADNDVERAEMGIIFIDEIDKIAKKKETTSRDVSGESVQQGMLKLLEGAEVEVPVGANSKNAMVPLTTINTRNILFICGGAFPDLDDIIKQRLRKKTSIGYEAELKDQFDKDKDIVKQVTIEDLKKFGMIPEFLGRLPIIYTLDPLDRDMYIKILKEPKNAILKQYQKLLALDEVDLQFDDGALEAIADKAMKKDTGARALRAIIEEFMLDIMYEIPKDDNIGKVTITKEYLEGCGGPRIEIRGGSIPLLSDSGRQE